MEKNEFIKLINLLVEKKMKQLLPGMVEKEVEKYLQSGIEPSMADFAADDDLKQLIPTGNKVPVIRDGTTKKTRKVEQKKWSNNDVINRILNDTAQDFKPLPKDPADAMSGGLSSFGQLMESEYSDIGSELTFNTNNMGQVLNKSLQTKIPIQSTSQESTETLKNQIISSGVDETIAGAMIKDYSGFLKVVDKKAKVRRGAGIKWKL